MNRYLCHSTHTGAVVHKAEPTPDFLLARYVAHALAIAHAPMRPLIFTFLLILALPIVCLASLDPIPPIKSPNGKYTASIRLKSHKDEVFGTVNQPQLVINGTRNNKTIQVLDLEVSDLDNRDSANFAWSPDGQFIVVALHQGQLYQFVIYRVTPSRLIRIEELPIPEKFKITPQHQRSRGGTAITKWLTPNTFVAEDTIGLARYTYRITKALGLEVIDAQPLD